MVENKNTTRSKLQLLIDEEPPAPEIIRRLTSQDARENETVTFTCTVQNDNQIDEDEPYSIAWFFNDKKLESSSNENDSKYVIDENPKTGICLLTIRNVTSEDEGAYRCVATNKYGSSLTTGFLAVLRRKKSQSPSPSSSRNASPSRSLSPSGNRGRDRSVSPLRYINLPMSKLARVTEELEILIHPTSSIVHEEEEEPVKTTEELPLPPPPPPPPPTPMQQEESSAVTTAESDESSPDSLVPSTTTSTTEEEKTLTAPPAPPPSNQEEQKPIIVTDLPARVRINEGEDLNVSCSITGIPEPTVRWTKNGVDIREDHRIDIYSDRGTYHLEISEVIPTDQGVYTINARNSLGHVSLQCHVEVNENIDRTKRLKVDGLFAYGTRQPTYKAPEFLIKPSNRTVHEGEPFQIFAKVIGNPAPQVVWLRLGKPLEDDGYHRIYDRDGQNYFEIPKISILDAGEFSCIASNMMGAVYSTFTVCVEAMTEPDSTGSEIEERSANVSDVDVNAQGPCCDTSEPNRDGKAEAILNKS